MENTAPEITKASVLDVETIVAISRKTFYETFAKDNSEEDMQLYLDENVNPEKLTAELNNPDSEFYLAKNNDETIGFLKVNFAKAQTELHDTQSLEIERIYVVQEFHGQKVGQLLFAKAVAIAQANNLNYIWLGVWEENVKAIEFYLKNGFVAFDKHEFTLGNDVQTDILMKLNLK
jgi:diamine N-acetyltransferase